MQLNANEFKYTDLTETNRNVYQIEIFEKWNLHNSITCRKILIVLKS